MVDEQTASEQILGERYRVLEAIGQGGMATVYRVQDQLLERVAAVKVLRDQFAADPAFVERFRREAKSAAALSHPNIVAVYDVGSDNGQHYIVMEYVDGTSLKQVIVSEAPFGLERAVNLASQILQALAYAHQRGLVHRDVKPQNILVAGDGTAKVADFGIARALSSTQATDSGVVFGTVHYCSPEQAQGQAVGPESDVYSLGVVLFEMLTGRVPFDGDSPVAIALKQVQEVPPAPSQLNPAVPPGLERIVLKALAKSPSDRYGSAGDMRQDLQQYQSLSGQSTADLTPVAAAMPIQVAVKPPKRRDWVSIVLAILIVGAIVGWVPLGMRVYDLFAHPAGASSQPTAVPTRTPSPLPPTVTPAPIGSRVTAPDLVGLPYAEAERQAAVLGLQLRIAREEFSSTQELFAVISQTVKAGTQVLVPSAIDVVVSKGPERTTVPNVLQRGAGSASDAVKKAGLNPLLVDTWSSSVQAGLVAVQVPGPGTVVQGGSVVTLWVSKGPEPIATPVPGTPVAGRTPTAGGTPTPVRSVARVPNVVGMSEEAAKLAISNAGLGNSYTNWQTANDVADKTFFFTIPVGHVLSQQPLAGSEVPVGTTVYLAARKE